MWEKNTSSEGHNNIALTTVVWEDKGRLLQYSAGLYNGCHGGSFKALEENILKEINKSFSD